MGRGMIRVKQKDIGLTTETISQRIGPGRRLTQLAGREGRVSMICTVMEVAKVMQDGLKPKS